MSNKEQEIQEILVALYRVNLGKFIEFLLANDVLVIDKGGRDLTSDELTRLIKEFANREVGL